MKTTSIFVAAVALATSALAIPSPIPVTASSSCSPPYPTSKPTTSPYHKGDDSKPWDRYSHGKPSKANRTICVNKDDAADMAETFRSLIQEYSDELALSTLTEDFTDYTSAVSIIINRGAAGPKNLSAATFTPRQAFIDAQGSQPQIPFTLLDVVHGCDSVSVRWLTERSANGQPTEAARLPVVGLAILKVVPAIDDDTALYRFRIQTLYSEFNAAAWLINLGVFVPAGSAEIIGSPSEITPGTAEK